MQRRGTLAKLVLTLVVCGALFYGVVIALDPWALHIGGRWTPLLIWQGSGKLITKGGVEYPLWVQFYPSSHFSQLHMDGLRPTGGLQGTASLCTSPGVIQRMTLSGTIYGSWCTTEDSLMTFRLLEPKIFDVGQRQGFFDLVGRWHGPELVMDDRGNVGSTFRSGLKIEHASVTLDWGSYSDFKAVCASAMNLPTRR
ncbi:MAG TPA: hypothetical protein VN176_04110 [Verrucomicrobiae bacterium]|jgi:hypothetical protein|nr:hypothetical protein [Verrucomicrobiae bacterium]